MKIRSILFVFLIAVVFYSCKKDSKQCPCVNGNSLIDVPSPNIFDSTGFAFFSMKKYYSYKGSAYTLDFSNNYAHNNSMTCRYGNWSPISVWGYKMDSAKVNGVRFTRYYPYYAAFDDVYNSYFAPPRTYQFFGDSTQHLIYLNSYTDNTPLPEYDLTGCTFPDSANINNDLSLNISNRKNAMQTCISILPTIDSYQLNIATKTIKSNEYFIVFEKERLQNTSFIGTGNFYIILTVFNWSKTTFRGKDIYFVSEHRYSKKIKLYNR